MKCPKFYSRSKRHVGPNSKDYFSVSLPKSFMEADLSESHALITSLHASDDNFEYSSKTLPQLVCLRDQKLTQFLALESTLSRKSIEVSPDSLQRALKELKSELDAKNLELKKETNNHHLAKPEVIRLQSHLQEAQNALSLATQSFARKNAALKEDLKKSQDRFDSAFDEGVLKGAQLCRERLFLTEAGQSFLNQLRKDLIEDYQLSTTYVADMGPHLGHFIKHGFKSALAQARELGFTGTLDVRKAVAGVQPSPAFRGDPLQPADSTWWKPVIEKAVSQFVAGPEIPTSFPAAVNPFFAFSASPTKAALL